jgi:hypothetical protein
MLSVYPDYFGCLSWICWLAVSPVLEGWLTWQPGNDGWLAGYFAMSPKLARLQCWQAMIAGWVKMLAGWLL